MRPAKGLVSASMRLRPPANFLFALMRYMKKESLCGHPLGAVREIEHRLRAVANNVPAVIGYWNRILMRR
jgi:hypothetical protein